MLLFYTLQMIQSDFFYLFTIYKQKNSAKIIIEHPVMPSPKSEPFFSPVASPTLPSTSAVKQLNGSCKSVNYFPFRWIRPALSMARFAFPFARDLAVHRLTFR